MANIFTKPITKTANLVETQEYTREVKVDDETYQTISFPQCLNDLTEDERQRFIGGILTSFAVEE